MHAANKKTIVAVDDSPELLEIVQTCLEAEGYRVVASRDLEGATPTVKETRPDLVIADVRGGGVADWHAVNSVKLDSSTASVPMLVCTGAVQELREREPWLREHGCDVLLKPFDLDELLAKVEQLTV